MNMRDYPSLHFDIYSNKGTIASLYVVLHFTVNVQSSVMTYTLK
jgi:hypothetical protein